MPNPPPACDTRFYRIVAEQTRLRKPRVLDIFNEPGSNHYYWLDRVPASLDEQELSHWEVLYAELLAGACYRETGYYGFYLRQYALDAARFIQRPRQADWRIKVVCTYLTVRHETIEIQ